LFMHYIAYLVAMDRVQPVKLSKAQTINRLSVRQGRCGRSCAVATDSRFAAAECASMAARTLGFVSSLDAVTRAEFSA
jgi:hypothetical protein